MPKSTFQSTIPRRWGLHLPDHVNQISESDRRRTQSYSFMQTTVMDPQNTQNRTTPRRIRLTVSSVTTKRLETLQTGPNLPPMQGPAKRPSREAKRNVRYKSTSPSSSGRSDVASTPNSTPVLGQPLRRSHRSKITSQALVESSSEVSLTRPSSPISMSYPVLEQVVPLQKWNLRSSKNNSDISDVFGEPITISPRPWRPLHPSTVHYLEHYYDIYQRTERERPPPLPGKPTIIQSSFHLASQNKGKLDDVLSYEQLSSSLASPRHQA